MNRNHRKVAITGIGMVTPVGNDAVTTWDSLQAGRSGAGMITNFDASGFTTTIGAEVKDFDPGAAFPDRKVRKYASRSHGFALGAAAEALADAGITPTGDTANRWGLSVGSGMMSVAYQDVDKVRRFCAPEGDFDPKGFLDPDFRTRNRAVLLYSLQKNNLFHWTHDFVNGALLLLPVSRKLCEHQLPPLFKKTNSALVS